MKRKEKVLIERGGVLEDEGEGSNKNVIGSSDLLKEGTKRNENDKVSSCSLDTIDFCVLTTDDFQDTTKRIMLCNFFRSQVVESRLLTMSGYPSELKYQLQSTLAVSKKHNDVQIPKMIMVTLAK